MGTCSKESKLSNNVLVDSTLNGICPTAAAIQRQLMLILSDLEVERYSRWTRHMSGFDCVKNVLCFCFCSLVEKRKICASTFQISINIEQLFNHWYNCSAGEQHVALAGKSKQDFQLASSPMTVIVHVLSYPFSVIIVYDKDCISQATRKIL